MFSICEDDSVLIHLGSIATLVRAISSSQRTTSAKMRRCQCCKAEILERLPRISGLFESFLRGFPETICHNFRTKGPISVWQILKWIWTCPQLNDIFANIIVLLSREQQSFKRGSFSYSPACY